VKLLGFGAFGVVNLMQHLDSGQHYAVKVIKKRDPKEDAKTRNESKLGMILDSEHVCKVHKYHEDKNHFYIIMDYLQGMDLFDFIRKNPKFFMTNPKAFWLVVKSILQGLAYLHSQGIAHFDIKPENVFLLLDDIGNIIGVKLIDLGLSMEVNKTTKVFRGTDAYMGPEFLHLCCPTGLPADIWSLGITAFVMLMGYLPIFSQNKDRQRCQEEIYSKIASLLSTISFNPFFKRSENAEIFEIEDFILSCLIVNPVNRLSADDLLKTIPVSTPLQLIP
jgi:serine/threonine protein kinase